MDIIEIMNVLTALRNAYITLNKSNIEEARRVIVNEIERLYKVLGRIEFVMWREEQEQIQNLSEEPDFDD